MYSKYVTVKVRVAPLVAYGGGEGQHCTAPTLSQLQR